MTDLTVSFLFIILILLAFFASQFKPDAEVPRTLYEASLAEKAGAVARAKQLEQALAARDKEDALSANGLTNELERLRREREALSVFAADIAVQKERLRAFQEDSAKANAEMARLADDRRRAAEQAAAAEAAIEPLKAELERLRSGQTVNPLEIYNGAVARRRTALLRRLQGQINAEFPDLEVSVSAANDALRFQGQGLFASNSDRLSGDRTLRVRRIGELLDAALSCFTIGERAAYDESCNGEYAMIEALQIEGHTDSDGSSAYNIDLSARRSVATYNAMVAHLPSLIDHRNLQGQPVLSVSGYGEDRPIEDNADQDARAANRRINLRFIMVLPPSVAEIDRIRRSLKDGVVQ